MHYAVDASPWTVTDAILVFWRLAMFFQPNGLDKVAWLTALEDTASSVATECV